MIGPLTKDGLIVAIVQPALCTWRKRDLGQNTLQPPAAGQAGVAKYCFQEAANCKTCNYNFFAALKEQEVEKEGDENDSQDSHFDSS